MTTVSLVLPEPPTVNTYWRPWRSRMVLTDAARLYRETVRALARRDAGVSQLGQWPVFAKPAEVMVVVAWHRATIRSGDTDNRLKPLLDALQGTVYSDDDQVGAILIWRNDTKQRPGLMDVAVEQWSLARMPQLLLHLGATRP